MDTFIDCEISEINTSIYITPNIEFQLNKFNSNEKLTCKNIDEQSLFATHKLKTELKLLYARMDLPILLYGARGCGKLTTLVGLLNTSHDIYFPSASEKDAYVNRINNLIYFKIVDNEYNKLLCYENAFVLNINILVNNVEIMQYLKYIFKLANEKNIDKTKKIFFITNIDLCNTEQQTYISYMLDKITEKAIYIMTCNSLNKINKKITTQMVKLNYGKMSKSEFTAVFLYNYSKIWSYVHLSPACIDKYYTIYINNAYNIGNTLAQIKYLIASYPSIKSITKDDELGLMSKIVRNFIKKNMKLTIISGANDIRKVLFCLLSLNMNLLDFCKELLHQLMQKSLPQVKKDLILAKCGELSTELIHSNKQFIAIEKYIYHIISIIFTEV